MLLSFVLYHYLVTCIELEVVGTSINVLIYHYVTRLIHNMFVYNVLFSGALESNDLIIVIINPLYSP